MGRRRGARAWGRTGRPAAARNDGTMSPAAFEHTCASFRAALISGAQRDDTDDLRAMLDDGYVSVPRDMTRAIRSAALGVALMRACERGCADAVVVMLDHGAEHSRANARGDTPLHVAAEHGHLGCVNALLGAGADLTARNHDGKTPIAMTRHPPTRAAISAEATRRRNGGTSTAGTSGPLDGPAMRRAERTRDDEENDEENNGRGDDVDARARNRQWRAASTPPPITTVTSSSSPNRPRGWGRSTPLSPLSPLSPNVRLASPLGLKGDERKTMREDTTAGTPLHRVRSRLRDDLRCAVCLRDFCTEGELKSTSPVTLPCGHSFCLECVIGMRGDGANTRPFRCPLDRSMVSGNLDLRVNATMRDLIRLVGRKLTVGDAGVVLGRGMPDELAEKGGASDENASPAPGLRRPSFAEVCSPVPP